MRKLLFILCILHGLPSEAQEYLLKTRLENFTGRFTSDPLGNVYRWSGGDLYRYNPDGQQTASFSSRDYGDITYVDASNPMKILVVYESFSKALLLDAKLSANVTIELNQPGGALIRWICLSREEGYWIFDPVVQAVRKLNDQLQTTIEGTPLSSVSTSGVQIQGIFDTGRWLILDAGIQGIVILDRFGTWFKTIPVTAPMGLQVRGPNEVMYKEGNAVIIYDIQKGTGTGFALPKNDAHDAVRVDGGRIFLLKSSLLEIYSY